MRTTITIAAAMSLIWSIALAGAAGLPGRDNPAGIDKPAVPAPTDDGQALSQENLLKCCKDAKTVFLANVKAIEHGQTNSMPPHVFSAIVFTDLVMLKGEKPGSLKGANPPTWGFSLNNVPGSADVTTGSSVIAAVKDNALVCVAPATDENVAAVKKALGEAATQASSKPTSATRPATVNDQAIATLKEAERIVKAELDKPKSTYGTHNELTARLKAIQDQIAELQAQAKDDSNNTSTPPAMTTQPATQPAAPKRVVVPPELYPN